MKTQLTKEQSQYLIELGLPKWKVQEIKPLDVSLKDWIPTIILTDLLEILPKEIEGNSIIITHHNDEILKYPCWNAYYEGICNSHLCEELIDSLYELCVWCLENKYL